MMRCSATRRLSGFDLTLRSRLVTSPAATMTLGEGGGLFAFVPLSICEIYVNCMVERVVGRGGGL